MSKQKRALTTGEVAQFVGVNFQTVLRWIQKGHLKAHKLPGRGDHRVTIPDFLKFLTEFDLPIPEEFQEGSNYVLVVEDEPLISKIIKMALEDAGYQVVTAANGFEAGALLATYKPKAITLDLKMPGLDGLGVLNFIRSNDKFDSMKVLIVSSHLEEDEEVYYQQGANGILHKPFQNDELIQKVEDLINS